MTLTDTNDRRIGIGLLVLASLMLGWVIYDLFQRYKAHAHGNTSVQPESSIRIPEAVKNPYNVGEIVNAHIFGEKRLEVAVQPKVEKPKKVEKTRLRLKLLGLVASSKDGMARALITAENGRLQSYGVGEKIENTDSSVHSIEETRVLLDRDGNLESLEMARPKLQKKEQNDQNSAASTARNEPVRRQQFNENNGSGFVEQGNLDAQNQQFDQQIDNDPYNQPGLEPNNPNFANNRVDRLPVPGDVIQEPNYNDPVLDQDPYNPDQGLQDPPYEEPAYEDGTETYSDSDNSQGEPPNRPSVAPKFPF